mgnify:CR=1 FL=1
MKKQYSENERAVLLAKYENSGKTKRSFAKDEKISETTLQTWLKQKNLVQGQDQKWVSAKTATTRPCKDAAVSISIGNFIISVPEGVDCRHLSAILEAVKTVC